jgi:hypothetical protein
MKNLILLSGICMVLGGASMSLLFFRSKDKRKAITFLGLILVGLGVCLNAYLNE